MTDPGASRVRTPRWVEWLDRTGLAATLLLPPALLHARAGAEALILLVDVLFLLRCGLTRDWRWLMVPWVVVGASWWLWLMLCSLPFVGIGGMPSLTQAASMARFLVLVAALENWTLRAETGRLWLGRIVAVCCVYISAHALWQAATGRNFYGAPRYLEGELTGPFTKPRAGAPLSHLLFPALLPAMDRLLARGRAGVVAALGLALAAVATMVLIGQRMPAMLTALGLLICGLVLRRLRKVVLASAVAGIALVLVSAAFYPTPYFRLVTKFSAQLNDFPTSDYGMIFSRALVIAGQHPILGRGFDGFRNACPDPATFMPWRAEPGVAPDGGGARICNIHPHNHYLQVLTDAGIPGLLLFASLVGLWLVRLARGLGDPPDALRVGLLVAAIIHVWPFASASSVAAVEIAGIFFLLLGWGLAEVRFAAPATTRRSALDRRGR